MTINAAHALGLGDEIGSLEPGKQADLVVWNVPTAAQIPYWPGADLARVVVKRGRVVHERAEGAGVAAAGRRGQVLPRASSSTVVVSVGRLEGVIASAGSGGRPRRPSRGRRCASASSQAASSSQTGIGTTMRGSSWAMSSAARVGRQRAADGHAGDIDRADVADLLLGEQVPDVPEVDRVEAVELDDERGLAAPLLALRVVAVGADAGHQDVADLVLAGSVEDERVLDARRQDRLAVARDLALGPAQRARRRGARTSRSRPSRRGRWDRRPPGTGPPARPRPCRAGGCTCARTR